MSTAGEDALIRELRQARQFNRGDVSRAEVSFACEALTCPVSLIRPGVMEEISRTKPMQGCICPRCRGPLRFVGTERGR